MTTKTESGKKRLYSLIPLETFKAILGIDDREESLAKYCLTIATHTIEQHCMRRILRKRHFELIEDTGDLLLPLKEYPVDEVLAVYALSRNAGVDGELVEDDFYRLITECREESPYCIAISPAVRRYRHIEAYKVVYWAGYAAGKVPPDLASACLELAAWNMARYKGRRIGMTGSVRGNGKDGEHFEASMPENVKKLLEPYRRRVI